MSALRLAAEQYLAMRRALGFKLTTQGRQLMSFVAYCEARGADHVTADLALEWATATPRASNDGVYQARRLDVVRIFARHLQPLDPATEVPSEDVLSHRYRRSGRPAATRSRPTATRAGCCSPSLPRKPANSPASSTCPIWTRR